MGAGNACCKGNDADKFEATEASQKKAPSTGADEYHITIDHSCGTRLGIDVDHQDGQTLLIDAVTGGLVEKWNTENAELAVKAGHRIIEINGIRGDVLQLVDECKKNKILNMVVKNS